MSAGGADAPPLLAAALAPGTAFDHAAAQARLAALFRLLSAAKALHQSRVAAFFTQRSAHACPPGWLGSLAALGGAAEIARALVKPSRLHTAPQTTHGLVGRQQRGHAARNDDTQPGHGKCDGSAGSGCDRARDGRGGFVTVTPAAAQSAQSAATAAAESAPPALPSDLVEFLDAAHRLTLTRAAVSLPEEEVSACMPPRLLHLKGVTPKKAHETARLAALVRALAVASQACGAIDVGSGSGYLGQALTAGHSASSAPPLPAVGIEGSASIHDAAGRRAQRLGSARDQSSGAAPAPPRRRAADKGPAALAAPGASLVDQHPASAAAAAEATVPSFATLQGRLEFTGAAADDAAVLGAARARLARARSPGPRAGPVLVGLHTCGDLTPAILRAFASAPDAASFACLACVGCCYHSLSLQCGSVNDVYRQQETDGRAPPATGSSAAGAGVGAAQPGFHAFPLSAALVQIAGGRGQACATIDAFSMRRAASHQGSRLLPQHAAELDFTATCALYRAVTQELTQALAAAGLQLASVRTRHSRAELGAGFAAYMERSFASARVRPLGDADAGSPPDGSRWAAQATKAAREAVMHARRDTAALLHPQDEAAQRAFVCEEEKEEQEDEGEGKGARSGRAPPLLWAGPELTPLFQQLWRLYRARRPLHRHLVAFVCLQNVVEEMIESVVLLDRICYLLEFPGCAPQVHAVPLFDEAVSPRNVALVVVRRRASYESL